MGNAVFLLFMLSQYWDGSLFLNFMLSQYWDGPFFSILFFPSIGAAVFRLFTLSQYWDGPSNGSGMPQRSMRAGTKADPYANVRDTPRPRYLAAATHGVCPIFPGILPKTNREQRKQRITPAILRRSVVYSCLSGILCSVHCRKFEGHSNAETGKPLIRVLAATNTLLGVKSR